MGQGSSKKSEKGPEGSGVPRKRKSMLERVAGKVKKLTNRRKKANQGEETIKHLEDAAKYTLKPGGQFGELETNSRGQFAVHDPDDKDRHQAQLGSLMGNGCSNSAATAVGAGIEKKEEAEVKKKRSVVGNVVHNVKKKMKPKPKWNDSQPEKVPIRANRKDLDEYLDASKPRPKDRDRPERRRPGDSKSRQLGDGVPDAAVPELDVGR